MSLYNQKELTKSLKNITKLDFRETEEFLGSQFNDVIYETRYEVLNYYIFQEDKNGK